jgi:hypothetical protein
MRFSGELMSIFLGVDVVFLYSVATSESFPGWAEPVKMELFTNPTFISLCSDMICLAVAHTFVNWWTGVLARPLVVTNADVLREFSLNQFISTANVFIVGRLIWHGFVAHDVVDVNHDVTIMTASAAALYVWRYLYVSQQSNYRL